MTDSLGEPPRQLGAEAEAACRQVIVSFAHHLDHREFSEAAALFDTDGVWERHGDKLVGPQQIMETISARDPKIIERHVMANILIRAESATVCTASSYVMIFRAVAGDRQIPVVAGPSVFAEFHDQLLLTGDGWRLRHRSAVPVFLAPGPAPGQS